jgi:hypothetical protein
MEKRLAVPPNMGLKTKTPRGLARRSTERVDYISTSIRGPIKKFGKGKEGKEFYTEDSESTEGAEKKKQIPRFARNDNYLWAWASAEVGVGRR